MVIGCNSLLKLLQFSRLLLVLYIVDGIADYFLVDGIPGKEPCLDFLTLFHNIVAVESYRAVAVGKIFGFPVEYFEDCIGAAGFVLIHRFDAAVAVVIFVVCGVALIHFFQIAVERPHIGIQTGHFPQSFELSCILVKEPGILTARINQAERMIYSDLNLRPDNLYC